MRLRFLTLVLLMLAGHAMAQQTKSLQKVMQLKMQGDGGSNGAAIAFHTVNKKYYAAMAGNTTYPLCVFNEQGYLVSGGQVESLADVRGLWFNTRKAKLQGNAYGENGWFEYTLDGNGIPTDHRIIMENASQPDPQSVGTFAAKLNQVLFFDGRDIYFYDVISGEVKESLSLEEMQYACDVVDKRNGKFIDMKLMEVIDDTFMHGVKIYRHKANFERNDYLVEVRIWLRTDGKFEGIIWQEWHDAYVPYSAKKKNNSSHE